jgi:hypothetical protein
MLPEPTLPKRRRAAQAQPQPWAMTPLFAVPDSPDIIPPPTSSPRGGLPPPVPPGPSPSTGRGGTRAPARGRRPDTRQARSGNPRKEPADLLTVTAERLRRALGRSFLRYGVSGDLETAVHAAMNVIEPVLDARDTEILRLRRLMGGKLPGR